MYSLQYKPVRMLCTPCSTSQSGCCVVPAVQASQAVVYSLQYKPVMLLFAALPVESSDILESTEVNQF